MSAAVAGLVTATLGGGDAKFLLDRLLEDGSGVVVRRAVPMYGLALRANLPYEVVRILPWSPVTMGPTGAVPETFWEKVGWAETTLVNVLLKQGELLYRGLVALVTILVNVGEAIWDWGMKALGEVRAAAQEAVEKAGAVLQELISYVVGTLSSMVGAFFDALASAVAGYVASVQEAQRRFLSEVVQWDGGGPGKLSTTLAAAAGMVAAMMGLAGYVQPILDALLTFSQSVEPVLRVLDPIFLLDTVVASLLPDAPSIGDLINQLMAQGTTLLLQALVGPTNSLATLLGLQVAAVPVDSTPKPSMAAALDVHQAAGPNDFSSDVLSGLEEATGGLEEGNATSLLEYGLISIALGVISLRFSESVHFVSKPSIPNARLAMFFGGLWELLGLILPIVALFSPSSVAASLVAFNYFAFTLPGGVVGIIGAMASGVIWVGILEILLLALGTYIVWDLSQG